MRIGRLNVTRIGAYWYTRRSTLSFSWSCRWTWKPEAFRPDCNGGWSVWWGWFGLERMVFNPGDDWGRNRHDCMMLILANLLDELREDEAANKAVGGGDE